jgi:polysaccharide deacetylase family protein (PEP-CTERM system associated)
VSQGAAGSDPGPGETGPIEDPPKTAAAFSADVEDYFQVEALRPFCPRERWTSFEDRTNGSTNRVLDLLDRRGAKGTFFVLGWTAERHPALVRRIAERGHEVASHGWDHELVTRQTPEVFRADVRRARAFLQDLSGQPVLGYRAPSYTIVQRTRWALPILAEEGYAYDSSIFPIARRRYGIPGAPRWPHRIAFPQGGAIAEFPLPTVRCGPLNVPATGGAYLRLLPYRFQERALSAFVASGRPYVLTVHPWELDAAQPRFAVGKRTRWTHYHNLHRTEERLGKLLSLAPYRPMRQVLSSLRLLESASSV